MKQRQKKLWLFALLIVALFLFSACSSTDEDAGTDTKGGETEDQNDANEEENNGENESATNTGGDLNIAVSAQPPTLDAHMTTATVALDVSRNIFETLVAANENHESTPMLAESYEISDDGLTYTFKLREGVSFHNGQEMKAEDVEASMNRWLGLSARAKTLLEGSEFVATDDYTVELRLAEVASDTLDIMAGQGQFPAIMPKDVIESASEEGVQEIIGTGPLMLDEWKQDQYVKLTKFEDYAMREEPSSGFVGKKEVLVDNVYYHIVIDSATRLAGLQTDEYHLADSMPYDNYEILLNTEGVETHVLLDGSLNMFYNKKAGMMADPKMRQMINAVVESDSVMRASFANEDLYILSNSFMNPEQVNWASNAGEESYNQNDPEKAKQLAEELGYDGEEIRMLATRDYDHHYNASIVIKEQLEQAGFNVSLEVYDWPTLLQKRDEEESWDIFFTGTGYVTTPSQLLVLSKSYAGWPDDEKADQLLDEIRSSLDHEDAKEKWDELQAYLWDDYVSSTLFGHYTRIIGASENIEGFTAFEGIIPWNVSIKE
ncbi:ABC transporter substrate-binding protein [Ornithinibacillus sp. 4-3]|uniref:ABC transporter substrate-binding protein n=1 Tax=Ornithinibacillus sp. 4-3 TaxID=3231488 RepID=A0AB39HU24_9BACI